MAELLDDDMMPHGGLVTYKAKVGQSSTKPIYGPVVTPERAQIQSSNRLVRDSQGAQVVSSTSVFLDPEHDIPVGSVMTVWAGMTKQRECTVITRFDDQDPDLPEFIEYALT